MVWLWFVLLASACLAKEIRHTLENSPAIGKLSPCRSANDIGITALMPISLGPVDDADQKRVNGDCKVSVQQEWHQVRGNLRFQATGSLELEDDKYIALSDRLVCDPDSSNCALTVTSVVSFTASETWGRSSSDSVGLSVGLEEVLTLQASRTEGSSHSITFSTTTSSQTSYSCSVSGNHTVYLAARVQYYLIFGYVSEWMIVRREFYVDDNGAIRERDYWGWDERCVALFRIPKVQYDRSIAGTRRCVVEPFPDCLCSNDIISAASC